MVAMEVMCLTIIRYTCLLVHLVGGNLASGVEEGVESFNRCSHEVVDLI
jgi:hypothetical protein